MMELKDAVSQKQDALLKSLQENLRIRSFRTAAEPGAPYGAGIRDCLEHALHTARELGLATADMEHQIGWCEYGEGAEMVAVLGHLDVVPEGEGWSVDPYGGAIRDNKIYGRGAMDDKGPTMAALYALAALRDTGLPLTKRIRVFFGTNEETGSADMKYYVKQGGELPVMGFTPDGAYPLINGEKGIVNATFSHAYAQNGPLRLKRLHGGSAPNVVPASAEAEFCCPMELALELAQRRTEKVRYTPTPTGLLVEAEGVSAHGAEPEAGENAIGRLLLALCALPLDAELAAVIGFLAQRLGMETDGRALGVALHDTVSGGLTLNLGVIEGDAAGLKLQINYRYPVTKRYEDCAPILEKAFADAGFTLEAQTHKPCLYIPPESRLIRTLLEVYGRMTGLPAAPKCIGGGTYAKAMPNVVAFGPVFPGDEVREHKPDEYIEVDKLMLNAQIIAEAMYQLAK